jgi:hypothetical protein
MHGAAKNRMPAGILIKFRSQSMGLQGFHPGRHATSGGATATKIKAALVSVGKPAYKPSNVALK